MGNANVSVIIPHFNAVSSLRNSIKSVLSQTVNVKEIIIIDDCSNDFLALITILESFGQMVPIQIIRLDVNYGASEARNRGVEIATGKYLAFLDADDVWDPSKIEIQYTLMEQQNLNISGHLYVQDVTVKSMYSSTLFRTKCILPARFVFGNPFFTPTVMVKRDNFIPFDKRYRRVDDYKCWLMNIKNKNNNNALILLPLAGGFKAAIGASGLTSSLKVMHESYILVLKDLYYERHVSLVFFILARFFEYVKYPLRLLRKLITSFLAINN